MNYYSEEEVIKKYNRFTITEKGTSFVSTLTPCELPQSDRERIRMELWKDMMVMHAGNVNADELAAQALEAFDKQFPNS